MSSELREALRRLVTDWAQGSLATAELHEQVEAIWDAGGEWPEYPHSDSRSIEVETLNQLEIMNHQLITRADAPEILTFLGTPPGAENIGWKRWQDYWQRIDYSRRSQELAGDSFYVSRR